MRIGIDIDDVITNTSEKIEEYVLKDKNKVKLQEHMVEIMKGNPSDTEIVDFCKKVYIKVFENVKLKENADVVIKNLINDGNEIYLITARGEKLEFFKGAEKITKDFLEKNFIKYNELIFNAFDKADLCVNNNIEVMIDDSVEHCEAVRNVGIKSIVFNSNVNKNIPTNVDRVNDWMELECKLIEMKR